MGLYITKSYKLIN